MPLTAIHAWVSLDCIRKDLIYRAHTQPRLRRSIQFGSFGSFTNFANKKVCETSTYNFPACTSFGYFLFFFLDPSFVAYRDIHRRASQGLVGQLPGRIMYFQWSLNAVFEAVTIESSP